MAGRRGPGIEVERGGVSPSGEVLITVHWRYPNGQHQLSESEALALLMTLMQEFFTAQAYARLIRAAVEADGHADGLLAEIARLLEEKMESRP